MSGMFTIFSRSYANVSVGVRVSELLATSCQIKHGQLIGASDHFKV